jgi:hypothetical protein
VPRPLSAYSPAARQAIRFAVLFEHDLIGKPVPAFPDHASPKEGSMNVNYGMEGAKYGISFGTALAIAISYTNNHSILWAIIHGFFSWLYVIYFALLK